MNANTINVCDKFLLTVKEAAAYFQIGEKKLRRLAEDNRDADWILYSGNRLLIKRKQFERFLDATDAI